MNQSFNIYYIIFSDVKILFVNLSNPKQLFKKYLIFIILTTRFILKNLIQCILFLHLFYLNHTKSSTILFLKATIHFKWRLSSPIFSRENAIFCMNRFSIIWFEAAYIYTNGIIYGCYFALIWIYLPKFKRKICSFSCFKSFGVELWINL